MVSISPVTYGLSANRGSTRASRTCTGTGSTIVVAHIESSRAHTPGANPTAAT